MSLYLHDQKLGSHSNDTSSSHKFMLKGRQTGAMHRGHGWVFRAESRDTMLAWFEDFKNLTEKTGSERDAFVRRQHARSVSAQSVGGGSVSSDGALDDDEDEAERLTSSQLEAALAASADAESSKAASQQAPAARPKPGGRFPSDLNINAHRDLRVPLSTSSAASSDEQQYARSDAVAAAAGATDTKPTRVESAKGETTETEDPAEAAARRNPLDAYRQDSYEDHGDQTYTTRDADDGLSERNAVVLTSTNANVLRDSSQQTSSFPDFVLNPTGPEEQYPPSSHDDAVTIGSTEQGFSAEDTAALPSSLSPYTVPPTETHPSTSVLNSVSPMSPHITHAPHDASRLSVDVVLVPVSPATTTTTLSDPDLGSTEHVAFGGTAGVNADAPSNKTSDAIAVDDTIPAPAPNPTVDTRRAGTSTNAHANANAPANGNPLSSDDAAALRLVTSLDSERGSMSGLHVPGEYVAG